MQIFIRNFWLKLVALLMALFVWLHVATDKTYNYEITLPVSEILLGDSLVPASDPPDSLLVSVSSNGKQLLRRRWRREGIRINATHLHPGTHFLDMTRSNTFLVGSAKNITLNDVIFPSQIQLTVDVEGAKSLPVEADIIAQADDGFAIGQRVIIVPDEITLYGPRSRLRDIRSVSTELKELAGLRNDVQLRLPIKTPKGYGFRLSHDTVLVSISVVAVKTRVYKDIPVIVFNTPADYQVRVIPPTIRVELSGPPEDIDLLNRNALTVSIDFRTIDSTNRALIRVDCPSNFAVRRTSVDSVTIIGTVADADSRD